MGAGGQRRRASLAAFSIFIAEWSRYSACACLAIGAAGCSLIAPTHETLRYPPSFAARAEAGSIAQWILAATSEGADGSTTRVYVPRGETLASTGQWITCVGSSRPLYGSPEKALSNLVESLRPHCGQLTQVSRNSDSDLTFSLTYGCRTEPREEMAGRIIFGRENAYEITYRGLVSRHPQPPGSCPSSVLRSKPRRECLDIVAPCRQ